MGIDHILALLVAERDKLNRAIAELGGTVTKRRGRPPKNPLAVPIAAANLAPPVPKTRGRKKMSAAQRKAQSLKMKAYWAKRRKQSKA